MWCEIKISGYWPGLCLLKERMSEFAPRLDRLGKDRPDQGRIFCLVEEERLDERLIALARILDEVEQQCSDDFTIQVRNLEGSEPPSGSDQYAEKFHPIPGLIIQPWSPTRFGQPAPDTVLLDPDSSFGTGKHPSTRLCLELLDRIADNREQKSNLLDLGCGTAVLAISALKLGAASVALAVDIDPEAVRVAVDNVALNNLAERITVRQGSWSAVVGRFDLIVANLVPSVLLSIGSGIAGHLKERGNVVVAGFRTGQAEEMVASFFAGQGLRVRERVDREG
jgi:ribosomal protein L11 methyltransferase